MKNDDISVAVRLTENPSSKLRARADVVLAVEGFIELFGFSIIESQGGSLRVAPPSRKGGDRYYDVAALRGRIKTLVDEAILAEYGRMVKSDNTVAFRRGSDVRSA